MSATTKFGIFGFLMLMMVLMVPMAGNVSHMLGTIDFSNMIGSSAGTSVVDDVPYLEFARHTDPSHIVQQSAEAQALITQTYQQWQVVKSNGPEQDLLCKVVNMVNGLTYVSMWFADGSGSTGSVSVYNADNGQWITSYPGKSRDLFEKGTPHGSKSWNIVPCDTLTPPGLSFMH